jgi:uncharacterized protein YndB with AHSA1/START domain
MNNLTTVENFKPIVKIIEVDLPLEQAFELFTAGAGSWWPLASHSVGGDQALACILEPRVGGRFYEVQRDGSESEWGQVVLWEPPRRVAFSFYPGRLPDSATQVEVVFQSRGKATRLTLTHSGWEHCAPQVQLERASYVGGWDYVLGKYLAVIADLIT